MVCNELNITCLMYFFIFHCCSYPVVCRKKGAVNYTDSERRLSGEMMTYWANFAKTG